jgi:hypothetical protein
MYTPQLLKAVVQGILIVDEAWLLEQHRPLSDFEVENFKCLFDKYDHLRDRTVKFYNCTERGTKKIWASIFEEGFGMKVVEKKTDAEYSFSLGHTFKRIEGLQDLGFPGKFVQSFFQE